MDTPSGFLTISRTENNILHIVLNRPDAMNSLNAELLKDFSDVLRQVKEDKRIKGILISGEGKAFCVGADINQLVSLDSQSGLEFAHRGQAIVRALEQLGKPSVAAIHGYALGGGCELAMAATMRIAADTANFGQPEVKLGIMPCLGGTQRLARLVGKGRALEMCLSGKIIKAPEAQAWGLVNEVVTENELIDRAKKILITLTQLPPLAMSNIMQAIDLGFDLNLSDAMEIEATSFALCCATKDKEEGVTAFLEKRTPQFRGE
jgi:enoyl-CoA hydratase